VGATVADANAGTERIFEVLDAKDGVVESALGQSFPMAESKEVGRSIEFRSVSFAYGEGKNVLKNLSFRIASGEVIGIVGPSGSGKTTLLNLLPRFYDVTQGTVLVEGKDIREIALTELRQNVAYVFQETFLLPGTIAENISFGSEGASRDQIIHAAKLANAHEFIERLSQGYDTTVGEGAARLSVGEKQRLSIARAFLKDAPILLLDEPTSSLDADTEAIVVESLQRLARNRTTLMAAHRIGTLAGADRILVLEEGSVTEFGPPATLAAGDGYFARLVKKRRAAVS